MPTKSKEHKHTTGSIPMTKKHEKTIKDMYKGMKPEHRLRHRISLLHDKPLKPVHRGIVNLASHLLKKEEVYGNGFWNPVKQGGSAWSIISKIPRIASSFIPFAPEILDLVLPMTLAEFEKDVEEREIKRAKQPARQPEKQSSAKIPVRQPLAKTYETADSRAERENKRAIQARQIESEALMKQGKKNMADRLKRKTELNERLGKIEKRLLNKNREESETRYLKPEYAHLIGTPGYEYAEVRPTIKLGRGFDGQAEESLEMLQNEGSIYGPAPNYDNTKEREQEYNFTAERNEDRRDVEKAENIAIREEELKKQYDNKFEDFDMASRLDDLVKRISETPDEEVEKTEIEPLLRFPIMYNYDQNSRPMPLVEWLITCGVSGQQFSTKEFGNTYMNQKPYAFLDMPINGGRLGKIDYSKLAYSPF